MSYIQLCQFLSKSSSKSVSEVRKTPFFDGLSGFLQLGVVFKISNIAHVAPLVHFRPNQAVNLCNIVSEVRKTLFFEILSWFLQLSVVFETSNITHVIPLVHTFLGKK